MAISYLNPNRAGLFSLIQDQGGRFRPPPQISAAEGRKILKFGTYVELVDVNALAKFQYLKSMRFSIMQIYVNFMHILSYNWKKLDLLELTNCFVIVLATFHQFLNEKPAQLALISYVFYCFTNFLCISLFLQLMYFIVFSYGIVWVFNITQYNSNFNFNESK